MMSQITAERETLNANHVQSLDCCPYCGTAEQHEPLDKNHVQPQPSSAPSLIFYRTRTRVQVELVINLSKDLNRALRANIEPLTDEIDYRYLDFALEHICNLNTALIGLYEILDAKLEEREAGEE